MSYVIISLFALCLCFLIMFLYEKGRTKIQKEKAERYERLNLGLKKELETVTGIQTIEEECEIEKEQKVNDILNGDAVTNAIDVLCKHGD